MKERRNRDIPLPNPQSAISNQQSAGLEVINANHVRGPFRVALWDFDGTLSLYRGGWQQVMVNLMVEELAQSGTGEPPEQLACLAQEWIVTLNGKPTIHQMLRLAQEIAARGGAPREAEEYCQVYQDRLLTLVNQRIGTVERGERQPLDLGVAGVREMLETLARHGLTLVLASGTEYEYVSRELRALGLEPYFGHHVYAPHGHDTSFSKRDVIARVLHELGAAGEQLVGFGDGIVETAEVKRVGGCAVGIASDEAGGAGPDPDKRRQLIEAGADLIVPDFRDCGPLLKELGF